MESPKTVAGYIAYLGTLLGVPSFGFLTPATGETAPPPPLEGTAAAETVLGPPPGKMIPTSLGRTHYVLEGSGPLVVMQHGIALNLEVMNVISEALVASGFRTLRYDLYDRGWSETDAARFPITSFAKHPIEFTTTMHVTQMRDVLEALGLAETPLVHIGHSTGGGVGLAYASTYPSHVRGLVLAAAVVLALNLPLMARFVDVPIIGPFLVRATLRTKKFGRSAYVDPDMPAIASRLEKAFALVEANCRYFAAIRSTNQHFVGFVGSAEGTYTKLCSEQHIPIHLVWGQSDSIVPYSQCQRLHAIAKEHQVDVTETAFEGIPHNIWSPDAKPQESVASIIDFVTKVRAGGSWAE